MKSVIGALFLTVTTAVSGGYSHDDVNVTPHDDGVFVVAQDAESTSSGSIDVASPSVPPSSVVPVSSAPVGSVSSGWDPLCVSNAMGEGLDPGVTCGVPVVPVAPGVGPVVPVVGEPSVVTVGMVWSAVREVPVPAAVLVVAPPGGETLVNLETVFSTEVGEFSTSVVLLGQRVRLVLSPVWFRWVAGDGVSWVTSGPGVGYSPGLPMGGYVALPS